MKTIKTFVLIFIAAVMLFSTSCAQDNHQHQGSDLYTVIPAMTATIPDAASFDGIDVKVENIVIASDSSAITLSVTNNKNEDISCDPWNVIEVYEDGKWYSCAKTHNDFGTREKGIQSNSSATIVYQIGQFNDITSVGKYRFRTNFYVDPAGARNKIEASLEFYVAGDEIGVTVNSFTYEGNTIHFSLTWINESDNAAYLSDHYTIQRLSSDVWEDCEPGEVKFLDNLYAIKSGESYDRSYPVSDHYSIDTYGNYRMILNYHTGSGDNTKTSQITIEFTVPFIIE